MKKPFSLICVICLIFISGIHSAAGSPPLPLHTVEGYGGVAITGSAYLVNPAEEGKFLGLPSIGGGSVYTPKGRYFGFATITETLWDRVELGYGFNVLNLHDLPRDITEATGIVIAEDRVFMHNFNARLALIKEDQFNLNWLPAVTFGFHYKKTDKLSAIDANLGGALTQAGIEDDEGYDFTLCASKLIKKLPRPLLINAVVRNTEAAHIGLLGFTGERKFVFEGNLVLFATDKFLLGAEYRQKPNEYTEIPGLVGEEDDWWSVVAAYVFNDHFTISGGVFNFGTILNHDDNGAVGLKIKYEF